MYMDVAEHDLIRLKRLLQHSSEFIAYFELADEKMLAWRAEMEQKRKVIEQEFTALSDLLHNTGTSSFHATMEKTLAMGETHVNTLQQQSEVLGQTLEQQQQLLHNLTIRHVEEINRHSKEAMQAISMQLAKYDVHQFHRIASESCDHVERVAHNALHKSNKLLDMFQIRFGLFATLISILTAFIIILYVCDEMPWELHEQVMNEREAGKVLLQAWPKLSHEEKVKILNSNGMTND